MTQLEAKQKLVELAILCNKVMVQTLSGYIATYASTVGKSCQDTLQYIDSLSNEELIAITKNTDAYADILKSMLA